MNDCIWGFIFCECEGICKKYLSANTGRGLKIYEQHRSEVEEALKPVIEKRKEEFNKL